jgi:Glycosyl hydrolases family 43
MRSGYQYFFICLLLWSGSKNFVQAQFNPIRNDAWWNDKKGNPINSQGGGIFRFKEPGTGILKYYWYGAHYYEADSFRVDPVRIYERANFRAVNCYSSTDLFNWIKENDVLTEADAFPAGKNTWAGRLGVAYIRELDLYAMFIQNGREVLIATSQSPTGKFVWNRKIDMTSRIGTSNTGDQTVFTDEETGISYLVYSYGRGRNKIYVSEIGVKDGVIDLLDCIKIFEGESREGNCMFKYQGKYYMFASNIYGWDGSFAYYLVADNIRGPYLPANEMLITKGCEADYAHVSQTGFFVSVKGSKQETIIYCGDRWAEYAGNGIGYNVWVPLSFQGQTPWFNSLSAWSLNAKTGEWKVDPENNYVRNGSFEADRKYIPSRFKPVQTELTGWVNKVISGNKISLDSLTSPLLNHNNSSADRKTVIGERSLCISDQTQFERKVSQVISSDEFVKIPDGPYTLEAWIKNSKGFSQLEMYARVNGKKYKYSIHQENAGWIKIRIEKIEVKNGSLEIGFNAEGEAGAFCYVDDVELKKQK